MRTERGGGGQRAHSPPDANSRWAFVARGRKQDAVVQQHESKTEIPIAAGRSRFRSKYPLPAHGRRQQGTTAHVKVEARAGSGGERARQGWGGSVRWVCGPYVHVCVGWQGVGVSSTIWVAGIKMMFVLRHLGMQRFAT